MNYSIDFSEITLEQYKEKLTKRNFIPSRQILKEKAKVHFNAFNPHHAQFFFNFLNSYNSL